MIEYKLYVPLSWCAPNLWGTLETDSNTIIKLLEDEKRLRWKFNGLGLCCWARPSPSLPTRISSRSPRLAPIRVRHHGQHRTSHKNEIHHIRAETTRRATECCLSLVMERNNNDDAMPRGGRWVIIRLFVTITIMLSRSKIVVFLLALHDTTICYFRPAPASASSRDLDFSSNSKSGFNNQDPERRETTLLISSVNLHLRSF